LNAIATPCRRHTACLQQSRECPCGDALPA
jgi:hypothetical protein